jgi:acyl-CoA synthetase (NDP forming)
MPETIERDASLAPLFAPRHVAVFGSASPDKHAYTVVRNLVRWEFPGAIYPINREGAAIEGRAGYRSLAELPVVPDCAMLVVPAANCVAVVRECAEAGVRFAVIGASGFAELATDAGYARQREIEEIARASGMRIVGPNTNGIYNATDRFSLGYNAAHGLVAPAGTVSVVSHSGALFDGIARRLELAGAGLSKFVPVGNEADLTLLDFLAYLIDDPATAVIGLVVEGLADGPRFRELAARARAVRKPIVALKIGRSNAGASATLAHSSRLAGGARAFDALLRECGVANVETVEGLAASAAVLAARHGRSPATDDAIVVVTSSGAGGALVADVASDHGWQLATGDGEWPEPVAGRLRALGTAARIRNPIDLGTLGNWALLSDVFRELDGHADGPVIVYAHNAPQPRMMDQLATALIERSARSAAPVLVLAPGGLRDDVEARLRENGIPVFHDTATCFAGLRSYFAIRAGAHVAPTPSWSPAPAAGEADAPLGPAGVPLSETASGALLRRFGVPVVESVTIAAADDLEAAARRTGFPLVLKALAPGVAHKHAAGFVAVGIDSLEALRGAYAAMTARARDAGFALGDVPFVVQPMLRGALELIAGVSWEATLGTFLVFGFGGLNAEIVDEVTLLPIPLDAATIRARIDASRLGAVLRATETTPGALATALTRALDALQRVAMFYGDRIASVDVNPLIVSGDALTAVDALIVPR